MKPKTVISLLIIALLVIAADIHWFNLRTSEDNNLFEYITGKECGSVQSLNQGAHNVKHGIAIDHYLTIQFSDELKVKKVSPQIYFTSTKGETVCFNIKQRVPLYCVISVILTIIAIIVGVVCVLAFLGNWIFD